MKLNSMSLLLKPSSCQCNMRCNYCFYFETAEKREVSNQGFMTKETAHKLIDECFIVSNPTSTIYFNFQGGEPTLVGLDFYVDFVDYVNKNKGNRTIEYALQTNGTTLNQKWFDFFVCHDFLIGISIDGYPSNHNHFRQFSMTKQNTYSIVMDNYKKLKEKGVRVNVLTVLTNELAINPSRYFKWLLANKIEHVQLIPCIDQGQYNLKPHNFENFYSVLFELWLQSIRNNYIIHIGLFDNLIQLMDHQYPQQCGMLGQCAMQNVIEANGDVYPCDFNCDDDKLLGNICVDSFDTIYKNSVLIQFLNKEELLDVCQNCSVQAMCHGNCKVLNKSFIKDNYCGYREFLIKNYNSLLYYFRMG